MSAKYSTAYDYRQFEEKKRPAIKEVSKQAKEKKKVSIIHAACYMLVVIAMLSLLIYTRAVQAEVSSEYEKTVALVNTTKGENSRLQVELEKQMSLQNIEQAAKELNMCEIQPSQVEYISFDVEDKVEIVKSKNIFEQAWDWICTLFS